MKKALALTLAVLMVLSLFAGCNSGSGTTTTTNAPAGTTTKAPAGTTTKAPATTAAPEEKVTISYFTTDAGISIPAGVDVNDNPFINVAKEYANCEVDFEIVPTADYQTKLNLLLASGKYPDIVHSAYNDNIVDVENRGGFIDLLDYYENSPIVQKWIDRDTFLAECANATTGEYYYIPMSTTGDGYPDGYWMRARWDLVEKYNNGAWPTTLDELVSTAEALKADDPTSVPFSAWCPGTMMFRYGAQFWRAYGFAFGELEFIKGDDDTYKFSVEYPEYKEALNFHKSLYEKGLLSQTFATNTEYSQFQNDVNNNNTLVVSDLVQQMVNVMNPTNNTAAVEGQVWLPAPLLEEYPVDRDWVMRRNEKFSAFDSGHRDHISKSSENPDVAWKLIEGFCTDEFYEMAFWGEEGKTYYVNANGERMIDGDYATAYSDASRTWGIVYSVVPGYGQGLPAQMATWKALGDAEYIDAFVANMENIASEATRQPSYPAIKALLSDDVTSKTDEAQGVMTSLAIQYIMGRIDEAQYDAGIADFLKTYGYMTEEYTNAYATAYGK